MEDIITKYGLPIAILGCDDFPILKKNKFSTIFEWWNLHDKVICRNKKRYNDFKPFYQ